MVKISPIVQTLYLTKRKFSKIPGLDPKAIIALKNANEFYKSGADVFDRGVLKGILSSKQTAVIDNVFQNIVNRIKFVISPKYRSQVREMEIDK